MPASSSFATAKSARPCGTRAAPVLLGGAATAATPSAWHDGQVTAGGVRWRVRRGGHGPLLVLLHGTGASLESWQACADLLVDRFSVLLLDLPGHGGSSLVSGGPVSLPHMAQALAALLTALQARPAVVVGHSAGAAVMLQWALAAAPSANPPAPAPAPVPASAPEPAPAPATTALMAVNGALQPLPGLSGLVFPGLARFMSRSACLTRLVAWHARDREAVRRMIDATGSRLPAHRVLQYQALLRNESHVAGALAMMAGWRLDQLLTALPRLALPLCLVSGLNDRTVLPQQARQLAALLPGSSLKELGGVGHLAHEEAPRRIAALIDALWQDTLQRRADVTAPCRLAASARGSAT